MGMQLSIAQSLEDEKTLNQWLLGKTELLSCQRLSPISPQKINLLGGCEAEAQVIFFEESKATILKNTKPVTGREFLHHVFPDDGLCIQWNRTQQISPGHYIAGRYYFSPDPVNCEETSQRLEVLLRSLFSYIKKHYPLKSNDRYPIFVGPDFANRVACGEIKLMYRNGKTQVPLVDRKGTAVI